MVLTMKLYTRVAWVEEGPPIMVFRGRCWKTLRKRGMTKYMRYHKKSTGEALWGELTWRGGNKKGYHEHFAFD